jgi:hypothetical protein
MRIGISQSVACMGLGALLGFVVATKDMAPASRADGVRHRSHRGVPPAVRDGRLELFLCPDILGEVWVDPAR